MEPAVRDFDSWGGWICAKVTGSSSAESPFSSAKASLLQSCGPRSAFPFPSWMLVVVCSVGTHERIFQRDEGVDLTVAMTSEIVMASASLS